MDSGKLTDPSRTDTLKLIQGGGVDVDKRVGGWSLLQSVADSVAGSKLRYVVVIRRAVMKGGDEGWLNCLRRLMLSFGVLTSSNLRFM